MRSTDQPLHESLPALLAERDWSIRELARRTRAEQDWGSHTTLRELMAGDFALTVRALEAIASVMRIDPRYFPEYRLALARRELDPNQVGMARALGNLEGSPRLARRLAKPSPRYPHPGSG